MIYKIRLLLYGAPATIQNIVCGTCTYLRRATKCNQHVEYKFSNVKNSIQRARALLVAPHAIVPTYTSVQKGNEKTDKGLKNSWSTCAPDRGLAGHVTPSPKE